MNRAPRIVIVGAGIGGLTLALALRRRGVDCEVHEGARVLSEVGAGVQIGPNGCRVLHHLGLAEELEAVGVRPLTGDLRRWEDGEILTRQPLGTAVVEQFGFPYYHLHRNDLHQILRRAWGDDQIVLDHRCVGVAEAGSGAEDSGVEVAFADGSRVSADVVIGADGIHSSVRSSLFGPERARFSGAAAWRGLVPVESVAHLDLPIVSTGHLGPGRHVVHYYVAAGRMVNIVGVAPTDDWTDESWTAPGDLEDALADFEGWNPIVRGLLEAMAPQVAAGRPILRWGMYDRDPLPVWGDGPVTLLGDACHPMLPYMAQGAVQAIEDAAVLAGVLARSDDLVAALRRYEDLRRDRTAAVQRAARENEHLFHLPDGEEQQARDARFAAARSSHRNAWLFDYDAVAAGDSD